MNAALTFSSVVIFGLESIQLVYPLKHSIENSTQKLSFRKVYYPSVTFIVIVYSLFGVFLSLRFGNETKEVIFYNYTPDRNFIFILQLFYVICLILTNGMLLFPVYNTTYGLSFVRRICERHVNLPAIKYVFDPLLYPSVHSSDMFCDMCLRL